MTMTILSRVSNNMKATKEAVRIHNNTNAIDHLTSFVHPCLSALPTNTVSPSKSPSRGRLSALNSS
jgi:hypothetical protein